MRSILNVPTLAAASLLAAIALPAVAGDQQRVQSATNGEWITLAGKVASVSGDRFTLDYGKNDITVEMDDYDWYNENALFPGDKVSVTGRMDKDFFQARTIEASSVYVNSLNQYFFANADDEEDAIYVSALNGRLQDGDWVSLTGRVTAKAGDDVTVDAGPYNYDVDANGHASNIKVGQRVSVYGRMDDADLFDDREIEANSIVGLSSAS